MIVELEKEDIEALLNMLNTSTFRGESAEKIVHLKKQLKDAKENGNTKVPK